MERLAALKLASEAAARPGTGRWLAARTGIGLACGVAAGAVLQPFGLPMWLPAAPALALVFAAVGARRLPWTAGLAGWLWLAAAATAGAQLGYVRMAAASARADAASQLLAALGGWQQIRGLVADDPAPTRRTSRLILSDVLVRTPHGWRGLPAKVAVFVPPYPEHEYGEYLQLRGKLQPLPPSEASAAMQRQDVRAEMAYPRVSYLANPQANPLLQAAFRLRHRLGAAISRTLPDPEASTLAATLLGLRSAMDKRQQQALVETGTVHLVVISGFKLSLLAMALQALALWCLRRVTPSRAIRAAATLVVLSAVAGYVVLSGATPSSLRAALMAGMVIAADLTGRPRDRMTALAVAVLAILLFNPFDLWDGGFQLSCLSVLGITLLAEPIAGGVVSLLRRWRRPTVDLPAIRRQDASHPFGWMSSALAEAAGASVAATLFDLPVLANSFHLVSLVSPLANLLGMPLLSPIMAFGMVGAGLGAMLLPLGAPFLWLAWAFTRALEWVVAATDAIPHAALPIGGMPWWLAGAYYALLLWLSWELARRRPENRRATSGAMPGPARWGLGAAVALAAAAGAIVAGRPDGALRVTFLAVPGEAALIQTPSGRNVLINGGRSGIELERQLGQLLAPWDRTIDLAIATTTRSDGVTGLVELANRYRVRRVVGPQPDKTSLTFARFERSAPRLQVAPGQAIELGGGARLEPVDAGSLAAAGSPASGEQPWRLSLGGRSILFADRLAPAPANLPDAIVEAVQRPAGGQIWIRPIGSGAGERDDEAIDLAEAGNVTVRLRPSAAPFAEP